MQVEPWLSEISRRVKFLQCPNWTNFMSVLHLSVTWTLWHGQFPYLSSRFVEDPEERIFEESRGNLKDSLRPRFSLSHNSKFWQPILHYSVPQIWWCVHIFHLLILFFGHFSKWSAVVSIHVWVAISWDSMPWYRWHEQIQQLDILFFRRPLDVRYMQCVHVLLLLCIVLHRSLFDVW